MNEQAPAAGRPSPGTADDCPDENGQPLPTGVVRAVVGIAEGLELSRILERLACAARDATGAQYAAIGVLGPDGLHQEFVHVGIPPEIAARIGRPPRGHGVFGHITQRRATVRVTDIGSHETSVGFPEHHPPMTAFLGVPLVVRDEVFGNLYLANKAGGFSDVDAAGLLVVLGLGHVVGQIPLGIWSDRIRNRRIILFICAAIGAVASLLVPALVQSPLMLYATIFVYGSIIGGMYTVGLAHLGSRLTGTDLAQANAAFVMCYAFGMLIGPQLVGISMDFYGPYGFGWGLCSFFLFYLAIFIIRVRLRPNG